jgi:hypothetical protein
MQQDRMVRLATVQSTFHARVIAARLGAEGMVTELRGNVDGPYPMGDVHVFVAQDDLDGAQELLLADEVESAFDADDEQGARLPAPPAWLYFGALVLVVALVLTLKSW